MALIRQTHIQCDFIYKKYYIILNDFNFDEIAKQTLIDPHLGSLAGS